MTTFRLAATPFEYAFPAARTALVVIDMQRDFIEPGGFGASLGNDVSLLARRSRRSPRCSRPGARVRGRSSTRARRTAPTSPTVRRPSACAARRRCASATPGRWAGS
jgi:hypothetical protein